MLHLTHETCLLMHCPLLLSAPKVGEIFLQGLPYDEPYVAVFENMDTVVFFNGCGNEAQLWQQFAGGVLPTREIEGAPPTWAPAVLSMQLL